MENKRPLILISNDDGIMAKGLNELIRFLRPLGEIVVMAPDRPRSGNSTAVTSTTPVHYSLVRKDVGLSIYKCSGTPTDCVKLAKHLVLDREPDLIVGGINHGDNSATNVHYSGTMGVVIEGCLNVNFPDTPEIKGVKICEQSKGRWIHEWEACPRRNDANYFWLIGEFADHEPENEKNDHWALTNGYAAITPTTVDLTAYGFMDELRGYCRQAGI